MKIKAIFKLLLNAVLFIIAVTLFAALFVLGLIVIIADMVEKRSLQPLSKALLMTAIGIDIAGNGWCAPLFNAVLIRKWSKHKFGTEIETISSVLGKNKLDNTLTLMGWGVANLLDRLDENHVIKSIKKC